MLGYQCVPNPLGKAEEMVATGHPPREKLETSVYPNELSLPLNALRPKCLHLQFRVPGAQGELPVQGGLQAAALSPPTSWFAIPTPGAASAQQGSIFSTPEGSRYRHKLNSSARPTSLGKNQDHRSSTATLGRVG